MKRLVLLVCGIASVLVVAIGAQTGVPPAKLLNPGTDSWPSYNGDYTGQRFSTLTKINDGNVNALSLGWMYRMNAAGGGNPGSIKGTPLQVNGVIYLTAPDHVWALDARTGREIWHFTWQSKGGIHIGNRGAAILNDWLFFETPDCNLVSLNIKDGSERWHKQICDLDQFYYGSVAPIIIKNHVMAGVSGDDLDVPGYVQAHDPETGEMQWRWYVVPQKKGEPGSETWPNEDAMKHGGGMTWQPFTYDPELNQMYVTTGNPQPVLIGDSRPGDNLWTCSIVALNVETGGVGADCGGIGFLGTGINLISTTNQGTCSDATPIVAVNPLLGPLARNGGPTQTIALLPGSPAIGAAGAGKTPARDQRGVKRADPDLGAYERR